MDPIIARFGPFTIYSYGLMVAVAYILGLYVARKEALRKQIKLDLIYDLVFYLIIGAIVGARLYYVLFYNPRIFVEDFVSIFKVWEGGLAIHGAILGGVISGILFCRRYKIDFWKLADIVAGPLAIGQAIGRIGCFLNGCCFGIPTNSFLGIRFPEQSLSYITYNNLRLHPTQLYESFLDFVIFVILWSLRKKTRFDGAIFLLYLMMYSSVRIVLSRIRGDGFYIWGSKIELAQVVSAVVFILAFVIFIRKNKRA